MKHASLALAAMLALTPGVRGQTRPAPQMILSVFGGLAGGTDLWSVARQPLVVLTSSGTDVDMLSLSRRIRPGVVAGVTATYFPSPHFGLAAEVSLLGLGLEDQCVLRYENTTFDAYNRQVCGDINGKQGAASTAAFFMGGLARLAPRAAVVPYARASVGITLSHATTEVAGRFVDEATQTLVTRVVYPDRGGGRVDPAASLAIGLMVPVGPGYQFRLEARDHILRVQQITGPAAPGTPGPPMVGRFVHNLALVVHFDIVLERRRGRRY